MEDQTIYESLGFDKPYLLITEDRIGESIDNSETVTDVMESEILTVMREQFGDGNYTVGTYEKKLLYSGFLIAEEIHRRRMRAAAFDALSSIMKRKFGDLDGE